MRYLLSEIHLIIFLTLAALTIFAAYNNPRPVFAFNVPVTVTIDHVLDLYQGEDVDFYPIITIANHEFGYDPTEAYHDPYDEQDDIFPAADWTRSRDVDSNIGSSIPITIQMWDEDDGFHGDDDHVDIFSGDGRDLNLNVNLSPCTVTGSGISTTCGSTIAAVGLGGNSDDEDDDNALIEFRVNVVENSAPGLGIECLHDPIWPQTTDSIDINARTLDGDLQPNTKLADSVEIWMAPTFNQPAKQGSGSDLSHAIGPFSGGGTFTYGCVARDEGDSVFSGWKVVQVGVPAEGSAVPVLYTGPRSQSIDIVFIPDSDDYTGPNDANFLEDVGTVISTYYSEEIFYLNQYKLNFWISQDLGNANGVVGTMCNNIPPTNWNTAYSFADVGALVHSTVFQDCAQTGLRLFSGDLVDWSGPRVFLHETGHTPFGLADEYCKPNACNGGYFSAPNEYSSKALCDAAKLVSETCRTWTDPRTGLSWWTSDPTPNDLMDDSQVPQRLDKKGIAFMFGECDVGRC